MYDEVAVWYFALFLFIVIFVLALCLENEGKYADKYHAQIIKKDKQICVLQAHIAKTPYKVC